MSKIKVLIADDHAILREGIVAILSFNDSIEIVGEAENGNDAITKTIELKPDVLLMDIAMPELGGLEATLEIKKRAPHVKILILSQYDDSVYVRRLLKAGVSGYILKHAVGRELISAIKAVAKGESYLHPSITSMVVDGYLSRKESLEDPYEKLTDREKQILKLLAEGHSHKEIANILKISAKTVIAHQTNISEKININSRAGFIKFAIRRGIIKID